MKFASTVVLLNAILASLSFAGQEIAETRDLKQTVTEVPLFKDRELQTATFGIFSKGNGPTHVGFFREHSWGSGSELNYFFMPHIGIGAEYIGSYAHESPDTNEGLSGKHVVDLHHVGGNLFFRWPIEAAHLAPYVYLGGGADFGDRRWAEAHAGAGVEYRFLQHFLPIVAERVGLFVDGRWTYLGDRSFPDDNQTRGDLNFFSARAGLRFAY